MLHSIIQNLIDEFAKLPGIGPKSAQRIAFWIMSAPSQEIAKLSEALENVKLNTRYCSNCGNITQKDLCVICLDPNRKSEIVCVVEEPKDLLAVENTHEFRGKYLILGGVIDPMHSIGPDQLRLVLLKDRVEKQKVIELILATNPTVAGRATSSYIINMFKNHSLKITRIAQGIPMGSEIEHADELTLSEALNYRQTLKNG